MQPLYTVDHESRHNSANHVEEERQVTAPSEISPLIRQYPEYVHPRNPVTTVIVSFLLLILVAGVIIGIYLLVIQNYSENILPPVETPLHLVARTQWDHSNSSQHVQELSPYTSNKVIVVQTNTDPCWTTESCIKLLQAMKANATTAKSPIPYNFLVSSDGQTYEALGWHHSTPISTQMSKGLLLAFIGNFNTVPPSQPQMQEAKIFFAVAVSQRHLQPSFRILGKNVRDSPAYLSQSFKKYPQWSREFADDLTK